MERVEDGHAVEQDEVLVRRPSAHVERSGEIGGGYHAGQNLDCPNGIGFGQPGHQTQFRLRDLADRHARGFEKAAPLAGLLRADGDALEHDRSGSQHKVDFDAPIGDDVDAPGDFPVSDPLRAQQVLTGQEALDSVVAEAVCFSDALDLIRCRRAGEQDVGGEHGRPVRIQDPAFHTARLCRSHAGQKGARREPQRSLPVDVNRRAANSRPQCIASSRYPVFGAPWGSGETLGLAEAVPARQRHPGAREPDS